MSGAILRSRAGMLSETLVLENDLQAPQVSKSNAPRFIHPGQLEGGGGRTGRGENATISIIRSQTGSDWNEGHAKF